MRFTNSGTGRRILPLALVAAAALAGAGCDLDTLLEAEDPFSVTPATARDTANLSTLYAGARSQFALAYGGLQNNEGGIVMMSGLMSDELYSSDSFTTRWEIDTRDIDYDGLSAASEHAFVYLQRARAEALNAIDLFQESPRAGNSQHSELWSIAGYAVTLLAENFCSGIPLSRITGTGVEFGEPRTTAELYTLAIDYFDNALAQPEAGSLQRDLARVGKARALLDMGEFQAAAQIAAQVDDEFDFLIDYASGSFFTPNTVFNMVNEEHRFSAALQEGTVNRGLPFGAVAPDDPRVEIDLTPVVGNSGIAAYEQFKYPSQSAPIPLADAIEARLIRAEAALELGNSAAYLPILNGVRADYFGLPALSDPGTPDARVDQFFAERAYSLWLTGHRLSDLRRLIRQYGRTEDEVFPTGTTLYGEEYGDAVSMPVPFDEVNNPNYTGCVDTGA